MDNRFENIAEPLQKLKHWVVCKNKLPFNPNNPAEYADISNPETWGTYEQCATLVKSGRFDGIAFAFSVDCGYYGIDLDHCRNLETGEIVPEAAEIIDKLNSYREISQSGTGIHVIMKGEVNWNHSKWITSAVKLEIFDYHFLTLTGEIPVTEKNPGALPAFVAERPEEIRQIISQYWPDMEESEQATGETCSPLPSWVTKEIIIEKSKRCKIHGETFRALLEGDLTVCNNDQSTADYQFMKPLAYYTRKNPALMEGIYLESKLCRKDGKWERRDTTYGTYGKRTIANAIKKTKLVWNPKEFAAEETKEQRIERALVALKSIEKRERDLTPETFGSLAVLKEYEPSQYSLIKAILGPIFKEKGIGAREFEAAVKQEQMKLKRLRLVSKDEKPCQLSDILPGVPALELVKPSGWNISMEYGIQQPPQGRREAVLACPVPVVLSRRLLNIDSGEEKMEMAFYRDGHWKQVTANRSVIFSRNGLIGLGDKGLPVSSESARYLIQYLGDFEQENLSIIPKVQSISRMGWIGKNNFLPGGLFDDITLDSSQSPGAMAHGYREEGSLEAWKEMAELVKPYPMARFALSASFAAPLLKLLGQRIIIVHLYGPSRGGKTTALDLALSVWGEPEGIKMNFNSTRVALEKSASFNCDLPLGIDERQVVGNKDGFIDSLIYLLSLGKGKARGNKDGSLQSFSSWRTIALTTGEEPLSGEGSAAGIKTRTIELYGKPIEDEETAVKIHRPLAANFGKAGPVFIRELIKQQSEAPGKVEADFAEFYERFKETFRDGMQSHIAAVSMICLADYYAGQWIFGIDGDKALSQAMELGGEVLSRLSTATSASDGKRAYDYIMSWHDVNRNSFNPSAPKYYGMMKDNFKDAHGAKYLCVLPTIFDEALRQGGFNPDRILKDWALDGTIKTETRGGENKTRHRVRIYDPSAGKQSQYIVVKLPSDKDDEDMESLPSDSIHTMNF